MIGYGDLLMGAAQKSGRNIKELRCISIFAHVFHMGRVGKLARNIDRMLCTPLRMAVERAGLLHFVDPGNIIYLPLIRHEASICTVHDMIPYLVRSKRLLGGSYTRAGSLLMDAILRRLETLDHIVCVSQTTKRDLLTFVDFDPDRVSVIPNAVFQTLNIAEPPECEQFRRRHGIPLDVHVVMHVGRNFYKNRKTVLRVFASLRETRNDIRLVLVGIMEPELIEEATLLGIQDHITVIPYISPEDMSVLYSTAAVLLFPSLYEGFGYPVVEAHLCGTPVVCSNAGSLPEVAGSDAIITEPDDIDSMSQAIFNILEQRSVGANFIMRETQQIRHISRSEWTERYINLYDKVADI